MRRLWIRSNELLRNNDFSVVLQKVKKTIIIKDLDELYHIKMFRLVNKRMLPYVNIEIKINFIFEKGYKFLNLLRELNKQSTVIFMDDNILKDHKVKQYEKLIEYIKEMPDEQYPKLRFEYIYFSDISPDIINKVQCLKGYDWEIKKFTFDCDLMKTAKYDSASLHSLKGIMVESLYIAGFRLKDYLINNVIMFPPQIQDYLKELEICIVTLKNEEFKNLIQKNKEYF